MHQSWMLLIQWKYVFDQLSGTNLVFPCSTASIAGLASGCIFTNHCVEIIGSTTVSQRWHVADGVHVRLAAAREAQLLQLGLHRLARLEAIQARERAALGVDVPSTSKMLIFGRLWRLPVAKSLKSCAGVTFTAPVPNFGSTSIGVGDDRDLARRRTGGARVLPMQVLVARIVRVHGDRGVAEHRLGARRRDDDLARPVGHRVGELEQLALRPLVVVDLEVARAPCGTTGTS